MEITGLENATNLKALIFSYDDLLKKIKVRSFRELIIGIKKYNSPLGLDGLNAHDDSLDGKIISYIQGLGISPGNFDIKRSIDLLADCVAITSVNDYYADIPSYESIIFSGNDTKNFENILAYLCKVLISTEALVDYEFKESRKEELSSRIEERLRALNKGFYYEFTSGDIERIQEIINELREEISNNPSFEPEHKQRLLKRLEILQSELHKKMSDLDRFWGLIGDAGVAIGKFGMDAKPIVDRLKEITSFAWKAQAHREELSSDSAFPVLELKD